MKVRCPECGKSTEANNTNKIKCRGCWQTIIIKDNKVVKVLPKELK